MHPSGQGSAIGLYEEYYVNHLIESLEAFSRQKNINQITKSSAGIVHWHSITASIVFLLRRLRK